MKWRILLLTVLFFAGVLWVERDFIQGVLPLVRRAPEVVPTETGALPFSVPKGFKASLFADKVPGARVLARDPKGVLVASLTSQGSIVALPDEDSDQKADSVEVVLSGLESPHGIAFVCASEASCLLYVAEENAVSSYSYDSELRTATDRKKIVDLPSDGGHFTRSLQLHPDGKRLLVSVGSSCNACEEKNPLRASIFSIDLATGKMAPFATGLRNTVFMAIHPVTGEIWGTEMGRDLLGDNLPPDEINILKEGAWYGWPWLYGKNVEDLAFSPNARPSFAQEAVRSHIDLQAHSAPLGLAFVPEEGWPEEYWHDLFIAYHGSWNRSEPTGYKVVRVQLDPKGKTVGEVTDFMTGFLQDGAAVGRPAGLLAEPGGALFVSDDRAGAIYRVERNSLEEN